MRKACHIWGKIHTFLVMDNKVSWVQWQNVSRGEIMKSLLCCTKLGIHPMCNGKRKFSQETNDMTLSEIGEKQ